MLYHRGHSQKVLGAGTYWLFRPFQAVKVMDMRPQVLTVGGQEILSADNVAVKASLALRIRLTAPEVTVHNAEAFQSVLYLEAQLIRAT